MSRADVRRVTEEMSITFSSGSTESSVADISQAEFVGFITSTAFGSSQITFKVGASSSSDASFYPLYLGSTQVVLIVSTSAARAYVLDVDRPAFSPWPFLKVDGNSTGDSARTWTVLTK